MYLRIHGRVEISLVGGQWSVVLSKEEEVVFLFICHSSFGIHYSTISMNELLSDLPPPMLFEGFSTKTFQFLHDLKKNNNKPWFDAHRADYENHLRQPSKALVAQMSLLFAEHSLPLIADPRRSLFRINRDIRFSKDKSPYKTHIGIVFPMSGLGEGEWFGCYFSFEPEGTRGVHSYCGGGVHMPSAPVLQRLRKRIDSNHEELTELANNPDFLAIYPTGLKGESLKRMPKGYNEAHPAASYLKMTSFEFAATIEQQQLTSSDLPQLLLKHCTAAIPLLEFFAVPVA